MNERQLSLESRLLQLQDEIKRLETSPLPPAQLKEKLQALCAERAELETALINLVVDPKNDVLSEAWGGFREGLLAAVQSLEATLRGTVTPPSDYAQPAPKAPTEGLLTRSLNWLTRRPATAWLGTLAFVYLLLIAVSALGSGFSALFGGAQAAKELFAFATNPFMGLLMGMLATAVIHSSSTKQECARSADAVYLLRAACGIREQQTFGRSQYARTRRCARSTIESRYHGRRPRASRGPSVAPPSRAFRQRAA